MDLAKNTVSVKGQQQTWDGDRPATLTKVGLGGCHWCTEGVFASLRGVVKVNQVWIAGQGKQGALFEAIEVVCEPAKISLAKLSEIHLHTHASASNHNDVSGEIF